MSTIREEPNRRFALIGAAGYIVPRHLRAIKDTGGVLVAATDPHDSVGILDGYFPNVAYFPEFERFDRHIEKLRRAGPDRRAEYVTICSPNYLHDAHVRFALRVGAHAICEKPLVLNPWNVDALAELERESGQRVYTILQLRVHPELLALRETVQQAGGGRRHDVDLDYITARGPWYHRSWKGNTEKSGGVATNIGIHFFDLLIWLFGGVESSRLLATGPQKAAGILDLHGARVRWRLSVDRADLPDKSGGKPVFRSLRVDGREVEFSEGFTNLHTRVYEETLAGRGFGLDDARPSIELAHQIRHAKPEQEPDFVFTRPLTEFE